jgi:phosphopantothenoylcysteine decarboxylase/phosphopantothenate--cysteine ligase
MWHHQATQANISLLGARGVRFVGPDEGVMACHEVGLGRLAEPAAILAAIEGFWAPKPLSGRHVLVTAGPTHEPIDPVRYIANRSSGRQGFAIAAALAELGARVSLVSGPVGLADPAGVAVTRVETAAEMLLACEAALPADAAIFAAAVADWRVQNPALSKMKKSAGPPLLDFAPNPDILARIAAPGPHRPRLVVGFAAETEHVLAHADAKLASKNCDWVVANDVRPETGIMGGRHNQVHLLTRAGQENWPAMSKTEVATRLAARIVHELV